MNFFTRSHNPLGNANGSLSALQDTWEAEEDRLRERLLLLRRKMLRGTTSGIVAVLDAIAQKALTELLELGTGFGSGGGDDGGGNGGGGTM